MNLMKKTLYEFYPILALLTAVLFIFLSLIIASSHSFLESEKESELAIKIINQFQLSSLKEGILIKNYVKVNNLNESSEIERELEKVRSNGRLLRESFDNILISRKIGNEELIMKYSEAKEIRLLLEDQRDKIFKIKRESLISRREMPAAAYELIDIYNKNLRESTLRISQIIEDLRLKGQKEKESFVYQVKVYSALFILSWILILILFVRKIYKIVNKIIVPIEELIEKTKDFICGNYGVKVRANSDITGIRSLQKNLSRLFKSVRMSQRSNVQKKKLLKKEHLEIIEAIRKNNDAGKYTSFKDLKNLLKITHPTLLSRVKYLEMNGYIKIEKSGREKNLFLTEKSDLF